jgi:hypothetical protein
MRRLWQILGAAALLLLFAAPWARYFDLVGEGTLRSLLLGATILWFATAPLWMLGPDRSRRRPDESGRP